MASTTSNPTMILMDLPVEMIDKILSYLSYDQIAKLRAVNRMFNMICSSKLNKGFNYVNQFHNRCLKSVKTKLPRRESERRHHPLARHSDILMAVETRLSMLSMTFNKYIEVHQCCFIPGKVLDEALKVLRIVNNCLTPQKSTGQFPLLPRPHDFLQEYRDVSSMAMEHFEDKVLPGIKETLRLENPRLYCFKSKENSQMFVPARAIEAERLRWTFKSEPSTETSGSVAVNSGTKRKSREDVDVTLVMLCKSMQARKMQVKSVGQSVDKLHRTVDQLLRRVKRENTQLRRQVARQDVTIKHLRRELRETRTAMNVMSKDLNQIKIDQSPAIGTKRKRESCDEDCGMIFSENCLN